VKHALEDWPGIEGRRSAWWYKMQLFNPSHGIEQLLYFDLDVVITGNLDWIFQLDPAYFWTIRDFRKLWRPTWQGINSSVMYWNVAAHAVLWNKFVQNGVNTVARMHAGDQDFLTANIPAKSLRFFDDATVNQSGGGCDAHNNAVVNQSGGECFAHDNATINQSSGDCWIYRFG
jgi:hypothetical protein